LVRKGDDLGEGIANKGITGRNGLSEVLTVKSKKSWYSESKGHIREQYLINNGIEVQRVGASIQELKDGSRSSQCSIDDVGVFESIESIDDKQSS